MKTIKTQEKFEKVVNYLLEKYKEYAVNIYFYNGDLMKVQTLEKMMYKFVKAFRNFDVEIINIYDSNLIEIFIQ